MSTLSVIVPNAIATSNLTSSTVLENDYPAWAAGTTYAKDAYVISTTTHRIYQSVQANNVGKDPTDIKNRAGTTVWWLDIGPTNRWAMFDSEVSTATKATNSFTVVLKPGLFNSIYLAGLDADEMTVLVKDAPGGEVIFSETFQLEGSAPGDYDEYFWDPFEPLSDFYVSDIEQYNSAELTVTLSKPGGTVKCGMFLTGDFRNLGRTLSGVKVKPRTFSYIKTDEFGETKIIRRKATTDLSLTAYIDPLEGDKVTTILQGLLDQPAVWMASNLPQHKTLRVVGLGSGVVDYPSSNVCQLSLDVMGIVSTST